MDMVVQARWLETYTLGDIAHRTGSVSFFFEKRCRRIHDFCLALTHGSCLTGQNQRQDVHSWGDFDKSEYTPSLSRRPPNRNLLPSVPPPPLTWLYTYNTRPLCRRKAGPHLEPMPRRVRSCHRKAT